MANRVEVEFVIDEQGGARRQLKDFADSMTSVQEAALDAGVPIDKIIERVRGMSPRQIDAVAASLRGVKKEAAEAAAQMERLQRTDSPGGSSRGALQAGPLATRSLLGRFERAAQEVKELEKASRGGGSGLRDLAAGAEEAGGRVSRLRGIVSEVKQSLKDASGRGSIFGDVIDIGGAAAGSAAAGLAIGGVAAIGSFAAAKFEEMRQKAETELHAIESVINKGLIGGTKEAANRLQEFEDLRKDIRIREATGESVSDKEIEKATQGQATNRAQLELFTRTIRERNRKFEITAEQLGETNIFERAKDRLASLKSEAVSTERLNRELERLEANFKRDGDIVAFNKGLEGTEKWTKAVTERFKRANEELDKQAHRRILQEGADITIKQLSQQLDSNNPFVRLFDQAEIRSDQFRKQFGSLGDDIVKQFKQVNDQVLSLDIFKQQFDTFGKISSLQSMMDDLQKNGGSTRRAEIDSIKSRREEIESEIHRRRQNGTLDYQTQNKLLSEFDRLGSRKGSLLFSEDASAQRAIDFGQRQLQQAINEGNLAKQQIANDFIINSTGNVSKLSDSQIQARNEALERKIKQEEANLERQQKAADTIKEAADIFKDSSGSLKDQIKKGIGVDVTVKDQSPSTKTNLGVSPGADTLFGSGSNLSNNL